MASKSILSSKSELSLCELGTLLVKKAHGLAVNKEVNSVRCASGCVKKAAGA